MQEKRVEKWNEMKKKLYAVCRRPQAALCNTCIGKRTLMTFHRTHKWSDNGHGIRMFNNIIFSAVSWLRSSNRCLLPFAVSLIWRLWCTTMRSLRMKSRIPMVCLALLIRLIPFKTTINRYFYWRWYTYCKWVSDPVIYHIAERLCKIRPEFREFR
jgi:hypothetical protein